MDGAPDLFSVHGKSALVTGASSGIGREIALALARRGCNVVVAARRKQKLDDLCQEIAHLAAPAGSSPPGAAVAVELDVAWREKEVDAVIQLAWDAFGGLDIVVNNAGLRGTKGTVLDIEEEEWDSVFAINVRGPWLVTKTVSRRMINTGRRNCSIINISSISGIERGLLAGAPAYSASKAAVIRLTSACAVELGNYGIRCNAIAPGLFTSEITQNLMKKPYMQKNAELLVPMQRWGNADPDLTSLVIWMACDSSSYVNGACFVVDGGQSLRRERIQSKI